jgi:hypothetical protein
VVKLKTEFFNVEVLCNVNYTVNSVGVLLVTIKKNVKTKQNERVGLILWFFFGD